MSKDNKDQRPVLRLISSDEANTKAVEAEAEGTLMPRPKSKLGQFMSAYADAIDREIQLILDL